MRRTIFAGVMAASIGGSGAILLMPAHTAADTGEAANAIQYLTGCQTSTLAPNDDGSTGVQNLGFSINYYGQNETQLYVNNNGNVSFGSAQGQFTPDGLSTAGHFPTIAPFFADVDTRTPGGTGGAPGYHHYSNTTEAPPPPDSVTYGQTTYNGHPAFCVLWHQVGYFSQHTDKTNNFQLLIVDRADTGTSDAGDNFDFIFNYDQVLWESGSASGGVNGFGGTCAEVGYTNGTGTEGTWYQNPNPNACGVLLDSSPTALTKGSQNTTIPGSYIFQARSGTVVTPPPTPVLTAQVPTGTGFAWSGPTATFTNPALDPVSDFSATIDWGDGTGPLPATLSGTALSGNSITGTHTYTHDGVYPVTTSLTDTASGTLTTSSTVHVYVPFVISGTSFVAASTHATHTTASFTDPDPGNSAESYHASIDWGDGTPATDPANVTQDSSNSGLYTVSGAHSFAHGGSFTVTTTVMYGSGDFSHTDQTTSTAAITQCTDTATGNGSWLSGVTWSGSSLTDGTVGAPGPNDDACIVGDTGTHVFIDAALQTPVKSLTLLSTNSLPGGGPTLTLCPPVAIIGGGGLAMSGLPGTGGASQLEVTHTLNIDAGSSLVLQTQGCTATIDGPAINAGTITLCSATLNTPAGLQNSGTLTASDATTCAQPVTTTAAHAIMHGGSRAQAHALSDTTSMVDTVSGPITNGGALTIGTGTTLNQVGAFTQTAAGTLNIGFAPDALFAVASPATLNGTFNAAVPAGTTLSNGEVHPVLQYTSESGAFSSVNGVNNGHAAYGANTMSFVVGTLTPILTLTGPSAGAAFGTPVNLNAVLSLPSTLPASLPVPAGTVQFSDNGAPIGGPRTLNGGTAGVAPVLSGGNHTITAHYGGNGLYVPLTASTVVHQAGPPVVLTAHNPPPAAGSTGGGSTVTGAVLATSTVATPPTTSSGGTAPVGGIGGGVPTGSPGGGGAPSGGGGGGNGSGEVTPPSFTLPGIVAVLSPLQISTSIKLIAINLLLALILVLLLALPAELLNSAVRENYSDVTRMMRITGGRLHKIHHLMSELPTHFTLVVFIVLGAVLYTFVDPAFGLNLTTAAELVGLLGAFLAITVTHDLARAFYLRKRMKKRSRLTTFPAGLVFAVGLVIISKVFHFQPGFIFGLMTGLAFSTELSDREDGKGLALASIIVLLVAVTAWFVWIPVKQIVDGSADPAFIYVVLDTLLATVWVAGIQSIIFAFIPLKFMDGEKVVRWNKFGWLGIYLFSMFIFVHTVLHPTSTRFGNSDQTSIISLAALLISFTLVAVVVWTFFFVRNRRRLRLAGAGEGNPTVD